ncbi:MAG: hypothetical protein AVDCRST_MAG89-3669, partial [uncultured Gemmatimonadetes bacterium]
TRRWATWRPSWTGARTNFGLTRRWTCWRTGWRWRSTGTWARPR